MTDDLNRKVPEDPEKINTSYNWELVYWADEFNVTIKDIKDAVKQTGNAVKDLKRYLYKFRDPPPLINSRKTYTRLHLQK